MYLINVASDTTVPYTVKWQIIESTGLFTFTFDVFKTNTDDSQIKIYTIQVVQKPYKENVFFSP